MSEDGQVSSHWFDDDAGPVVRPYAMTRGRTTSTAQHRLDLIAVVVTEPAAGDPETDPTLSPEHVDIVGLCRSTPQSVAELAAELDLPIGVVRVLVGDLVHAGQNGFTYPCGDVGSLTDRLEQLVALGPAGRTAFGERSKEIVQAFGIDVVARTTADVAELVVRRARSARGG